MSKIEEITSIKNKIDTELKSIDSGYLEDLAIEISDFIYKYEEIAEIEGDEELLDLLGTLGSQLEDLVADLEDAQEFLKRLEELLDNDKHSN